MVKKKTNKESSYINENITQENNKSSNNINSYIIIGLITSISLIIFLILFKRRKDKEDAQN